MAKAITLTAAMLVLFTIGCTGPRGTTTGPLTITGDTVGDTVEEEPIPQSLPVDPDPLCCDMPSADDAALLTTCQDAETWFEDAVGLLEPTNDKTTPPAPPSGPVCPPSGAADGGAPPKRNCCVCEFWDVPACRGKRSEADCKAADPDCQWVRETCKPRHEKDCEDWIQAPEQQRWCDAVAIISRGAPSAPTGGLTGCTAFRHRYEGHGLGCVTLRQKVAVCVQSQPACSDFEFGDNGCSTFDNIAAARAEMERIIKLLGGSQCVKVSANQCTSSKSCQSFYTFTITASGVCNKPGPCNDGAMCHKQDEIALCSTATGITSEICCCNSSGENCKWKVGTRSCN